MATRPMPTTEQGIAVHLERGHGLRGQFPFRRWRLEALRLAHEQEHEMGADHDHGDDKEGER